MIVSTYKRLKAWLHRYERWLMPSMLLGGTALDAWQFHALSVESTFMISAVYAFLCGIALIIMVRSTGEERGIMRYVHLAAPYIQQFTIGALLSTALLFYWFSGSLVASWPLIVAFALLMVSNELLRRIFIRPMVQVGVFYFALFALFSVASAYLLNSLDPWVFIAGGVASLLAMAIFQLFFSYTDRINNMYGRMWAIVLSIFGLMTAAYFANLIPPIPLALREAGMYYSVTRVGDDYVLQGVEETWLQRIIPGETFTVTASQPLYAFTSIYAPSNLSTTIVHRWERHDESVGWVTTDNLSYILSGGRVEGYRGYSMKSALTPGKWRVTVTTGRGQVLGRIYFAVEKAYEGEGM